MNSATMPRNESSELDGQEFELVLGNKQLLSLFFIVIILLGVFFAMGYAVGRNSSPVETARQTDQSYERQSAPSAVASSTTKRDTTIAVQQPAAASDEQPAASAPEVQESHPTPAKSAHAAATPKPIELPSVTLTHPQVGQTYLQVLAVAKSEADVLAEVLGKKGFRALVAPGPNDKIFRVLVGPAKDAEEIAKLKSELEAAGFKPFIKKY